MKHFLRIATLAVLLLLGYTPSGMSQACSVQHLLMKVNSVNSTSTSCSINVDISWLQASNNGNKFTNLHMWLSQNYPSLPLGYKKPPAATDLAGALATLVIANSGSATPSLSSTYPPNTGVTMIGLTSSSSISKTSNYPSAGLDSFRVSNVTITLPGANSCASSFVVKGDVWSSQANNDATVQCSSPNQTFTTTDVTVSGLVACTSPRQFQVLIGTSWLTSINFTYSVYADTDNSGGYSSSDPFVYSASGSVVAGTRFNSGLISYSQNLGSNLSVVVNVSGIPIAATGLITNGCALPVKFKNFEATRENSTVTVKWITTMEQNNTGFEIQRKENNGSFSTIQFVHSKSKDGQSSIELAYTAKDLNPFEGTAQYRVAQVDMDGHKSFSTIAVVNSKPSASTNVLIYPNPAISGNTNLVFNNTDAKIIYLTDMNGRVLRTIAGYSGSSLQLAGLMRGVYVVKIINEKKNEVITEKITAQ